MQFVAQCKALFSAAPLIKTLRVMKLTAFLLLVFCVHVSAEGLSQHITFSGRNIPLEKVFSEIEKQTGYVIFFDKHQVKMAEPVIVHAKALPLDEFLAKVLKDRPLDYFLTNKTIIISRKTAPPSGTPEAAIPALPEPPIEIRGRVVDERGEPLPGVSILVKGTQTGTATDANGNYALSVPENSSRILAFSFVGMERQEVSIAGRGTTISVTLRADLTQQEEIVVRGYGTQKKANLTGSVASIGSAQLVNRPVPNMSQAIQGQLPGVQVVTPGGQPGRATGRIKIRGLGTMNNADPMIVVDGLVVPTWEDLNPNDIENITVLKDASASAIYGSRAANGVLVITTKRGKAGTPKLSYNGYVGKQSFTTLPEFLDSYNYALLMNEGLVNEGSPARYTQEELEKFRTGSDPVSYPNTDWLDLLYQGRGIQHSNNVSVSGGSDASRYLLSVGYLDEEGLIKNTRSDRYNIRLNMDTKVSDRLNLGLTSTMSRQRIISPSRSMAFIISQLERVPPTELNKYPDGSWVRYIDGNHIQDVEEGGIRTDQVSHVYGNIFAELKLMKGLTWRNTAGIDYNIIDMESHRTDITFGNGVYQGPNSLTDGFTRSQRVTLQSLLMYQTNIGSHHLSALAGAEREANRMDYNEGYRQEFPSNDLTELNAGSLVGQRNAGYSLENRLKSYFGRLNYDFKGRYLFEASVRYDGSSKFASDRRWGLFPSFSAGWRISEEDFMKSVSGISDLKIRGSYGSVGNNATADYQYIPRIALGQDYPIFDAMNQGAAQIAAANPNLEWEKSTSFNIGVDLGLIRNRLTITADYYDRLTDNILIGIPVSPQFGLPAPTVNAGAMRNRGFEFLVTYRGGNSSGDFSYNTSFNLSINENRVEKFPVPAISSGQYLYQTIKMEGHPWDAFYGFEVEGLYQTAEQLTTAPKIAGTPVKLGDVIFRDQNKDGMINGDDRVVLGSEVPGVTFGINLGFKYRSFDLNLFGQGVTDYQQKVTIQYMTAFFNGGKALSRHLDRWTPETPNSRFPRTAVTQHYNYSWMSSLNVVDATYFRLKNLQVGYTLPPAFTQRYGMEYLRLYMSCQNVFTITNIYEGIDPEAASIYSGVPDGKYNNVRVLTVGLNVNF